MAFIDALEKLGFSFWQVIFVFSLVYLRNDISKLISRVSAVKIGENEITLQKHSAAVNDLTEIKAQLESDNINAVNHTIEEKINKRVLGALINIKKNTSFLWENLNSRDGVEIISRIKDSTFLKVKDDLDTLCNAGYIEYEPHRRNNENGSIFKVTLKIRNNDINNFIAEADQY